MNIWFSLFDRHDSDQPEQFNISSTSVAVANEHRDEFKFFFFLIARALSFRGLSFRDTRLGQAAERHPQHMSYDPTSKVSHYKTVIQPVSPE